MERKNHFLKRVFAVLMTVIMVFSAVPLNGFAGFDWKAFAIDDSQKLVLETGDRITRAEWLHNLALVFEMTVEDDIYPDNYFSDLDDTHKYYYDVLLNVNFGVIDVEAGGEVNPDGLLTRSFAAHTLNFCLGYQLENNDIYSFTDSTYCEYPSDAQVAVNRDWLKLVDGEFCPENSVTDKEVKTMLDDAKAVLNDSEIDVDYDSSFTFSSDVVEVEDGTEIEIVDNLITIYDSPVEITTGDIFAVYKSGIPNIYRAKTVSLQNNATVISATYIDDTNGDYILEADAQGEADLEDVVITPAEGVDINLNYEEEKVSLFAFGNSNKKKKLANISAKGSIDLGVLGSSLSYSVVLNNPIIQYAYNIGKRTAQVSFESDVEVSTSLDVDALANSEKEVLIFNLGIPGVGGLDVYLKFDLSGSVSTVVKSSCKVGASYNPKDNFRTIKNFSSRTFFFEATISSSAGVIVKFGVTQLPFVKAYLYAEAGGKASLSIKTYRSDLPKQCVEFAAYVYANYGASFSLKAGIFSFSSNYQEPVWNSTTSPAKIVKHYEDNKLVTKCTRGGIGSHSNYYTKFDSVYGGGWSNGNNSYGFNAIGEPIQIFGYSLDDDDNATITSYKGNATVVSIPDTIDGYKVVGIGNRAFANCKNLKSVKLPKNLAKIKSQAFRNTAITEIDIPDSVTEISDGAFADCKLLASVSLPKSLETMGAYAFACCESLTSIEIPKSLKTTTNARYYEYIGTYCFGPFFRCDNLKTVTFEDGVTLIPQGLFANNEGLEEIIIPDTVTSIEYKAFDECKNLKSVKLLKNLEKIKSQAFRNTAITEIDIPDSVTEISDGAFANCKNLKSVNLSKSLETMGAYAFACCESLTSIEIPKSLKTTTNAHYYEYIGTYCFGPFFRCDNLKTVTFEDGVTLIPQGLFANNEGLEEIIIPDTVTSIEYKAFDECKNLKSVKLLKNLAKIKSQAFRNTAITEIDIPDSVTEISDGAFANCKNLKSVNLSKSLETMGAYAFACCESLTSIEIPKSLKTTTNAHYYEYIGTYCFGPFFRCDNLKTVTFEDGVTLIPQGLFANNEGLEEIIIPDTVTKIDYQAFLRCKNLKKIVLSAEIEEIAAEAFKETSIETLDIPNSVTLMGNEVFRSCTSLKSVTLPNRRENIGEYMFEGCTSLEKIELPSTVTTIHNRAFKNCTSLKEVILNDNLTKIDSYAFENCDGLVEISIPDSVTSYGEGVFYDCDALTNVTLGNGMTSLPKRFFEHCDALKNVSLPYRTSSIGDSAFKESVSFTTITIPRATTSIASNAFSYPAKLTINGVAGTYAETYAKEIGATFVDKQVNATAVTLDKETVKLNRGQSTKLVMTVTPTNFTDEVSWKSSNTNVATISADGTITAKSIGDATIKLTVGNVSASCKVTVVQPVTSVNIDKSNVTMQAYDTYQLHLSIYPNNADNKTVEWSSSASDIASVDQNGLVTAHKKGEAIIRVDAKDGSNKYDTCKIIVSNNGVIATTISELESTHNYAVNCTDFWQYTIDGAECISVTFDLNTKMEDGFDYLYIYDKDNNKVGTYTGEELSGKTVIIPGDTFRIQLDSDDSGTEWGFKVVDVKSVLAHEHYYTSEITKSATCTEEGIKTYSCSCGDIYTETISATGHTKVTDRSVAPTCTSTGLTEGSHCSVCGETIVAQEIVAKKAHTSDKGTVTTKATCTQIGTKTYKCTVCKAVLKTEKIDKVAHTYKTVITKATTSKSGSKVTSCTVCGKVKSKSTIAKISSVKLSTTSYTYNGKTKTPTVTVKDSNGKTLKNGTDYTVKYSSSSRKNVGTYTVTVTFKGNYSGTKKLTFKIVPKSTSISKLTAGKKSFTAKWSKQSTQTTGYQIQYSTSSKMTNATTKTISKNSTTSQTISGLKSSKTYYVRIRTYKTVNGSKIYSSWSSVKSVKVK